MKRNTEFLNSIERTSKGVRCFYAKMGVIQMEEKMEEYSAILEENIKAHGVVLETVVAMEELAELIQAISKVKRYGFVGEYKDNLIEEIADVDIVITELLMMFDILPCEVESIMDSKIQRIKKRLDKTEYTEYFDSNGNVWKL